MADEQENTEKEAHVAQRHDAGIGMKRLMKTTKNLQSLPSGLP
jgi:hypothetical protein